MLRLVAVMIAALSTDVCTSSSLKSMHNSEDEGILKALRDLTDAAMATSAKNSWNFPADKIHSSDGKFPRSGWWISKVIFPQTIKKHQDVSSYNLNSFGLRYGK
uniref:Kisspeptin 1 n=1 Tax=Scophthalmus maximus TaxID=52904 RepID=A0A8T9EEK5_SCOMX|nr:kisspeptin 1 [Scophthalmus maximus]